MAEPLVGILVGSESDRARMQAAMDELDARDLASASVGACAVTFRTRPPADRSRPSMASVPAWKTRTPGSASARSMPAIGNRFRYSPG